MLELSKPTQSAPSSDAGATPAPHPARARFAEEPASAEADDDRSIGWCNRGRAAEGRVERAEERLAQAEEWYDRCDDGGIANYCSRSSLEAAEREVERAGGAGRPRAGLPPIRLRSRLAPVRALARQRAAADARVRTQSR